MKFSKKMFAAVLVAAAVSVGLPVPCYAWTLGSSSGLFQHFGDRNKAYVKIWVTEGDPTELEAHVYTTQRYKGSTNVLKHKRVTKVIKRKEYDYGESTFSAVAAREAERGYRIISYSGKAKVKGVRKEEVGTQLVY